ncbi:MAG: epoxyqueuosine reductase QueH [Candidatus Latescibacteria bacterium]|nr:epoxyqueuosine reductase QueH [Candidatus Latescibacterota bacterium]
MKKNLLLHVCCGVCASRVIEKLLPSYNITGFFYNPNIEPPDEYQHRLQATEILFNHYHLDLIRGDYETKTWHDAVTGFEHWAEGGRRCWRCFKLRLEETAELSDEKTFPCFATTLTVNPHKDAQFINNWGLYYAKLYNKKYVPINLSADDRYNLTIAKKLDLYRQKYCGCVYSANI